MPQKEIAGKMIDLDDNGYMTDFNQWSKEVAIELAKENDIDSLTDKHWEVIEYLQKCHLDSVTLSIRKVGKSGVTTIKEMYQLFPGGPLKISTLIAGIPKPASCI